MVRPCCGRCRSCEEKPSDAGSSSRIRYVTFDDSQGRGKAQIILADRLYGHMLPFYFPLCLERI